MNVRDTATTTADAGAQVAGGLQAVGDTAGFAVVADIGGTNARFACVRAAGGGADHVRTLPVGAHATVVDALRAYLQKLGLPEHTDLRATRVVLAVASTITGDQVALTNGPWSFSQQAVARSLGARSLLVLNDFEALALSLPRLTAQQMRPWDEAPNPAQAARQVMSVVGPGTGLGVASVVPTAHGWQALPGEGGHTTLAPADDFESELLRHARSEFSHVSGERFLSGVGLPVLHRAVAAVLGQAASNLTAEAIIERGLARSDAACDQTVDTFCAMLGGLAGNVALTTGARGGLFIGGGIVPRLGERFFQSRFRERFEAKGRFSAFLQGIPTALITDTLAALSGAALAADQQV
jgi:glucokinase